MGCPDLLLTAWPWLVLLIVLNAFEIALLITVWSRLHVARDTVMDAIEARLLELDQDEGVVNPSRSRRSEIPRAS
jgi:hypothetical protein